MIKGKRKKNKVKKKKRNEGLKNMFKLYGEDIKATSMFNEVHMISITPLTTNNDTITKMI